MFQRTTPKKCMNTETHLPDLVINIELNKQMSGKLWRLHNPIYVDHAGLLTTLNGSELDVAIQNKTIITADEWREINIKPPEGELYVDCVSGLPAVDPKTGELLDNTGPIAKDKIICGEWVRIKNFITIHGTTVFVDSRTKEPTALVGSALFNALDNGTVIGTCVKVKVGKIKSRYSEPSLHQSTARVNKLFFTPQLPPRNVDHFKDQENTPVAKKQRWDDFESVFENQEFLALTPLPELPFVPILSQNPINLLDDAIEEILDLKSAVEVDYERRTLK